eukprot:jgi/Tetstr1/445739/TSEL_033387.t1
MHDDLQRQLISAARNLLNTNWMDELRGNAGRPRAQNPHAAARPNPNPAPLGPKACANCPGDHKTCQHPADEPITPPCPKCHQSHALVGKLATPYPTGPSTDKGQG